MATDLSPDTESFIQQEIAIVAFQYSRRRHRSRYLDAQTSARPDESTGTKAAVKLDEGEFEEFDDEGLRQLFESLIARAENKSSSNVTWRLTGIDCPERARSDLDAITAYLAGNSPQAARDVLSELRDTFHVARGNPEIGSARDDLHPNARTIYSRPTGEQLRRRSFTTSAYGVEISDIDSRSTRLGKNLYAPR